ncbi:hypothetical protein [Pseudomonas sp. RA_15y_Pfl2_54]|uniref:hypothetical protein n=1 Tax=Pseudomonas sp. RA_15y_Pfl2_54 TaxID=3088704 RepID=UPI0030D6E9DC
MSIATMASIGSLLFGLLSAVFWVVSAVVKAPPPPELEGKPDGSYWGGNVLNGGDLYGTLRAQSKWNSRAAFAASAAVLLQIAVGFL